MTNLQTHLSKIHWLVWAAFALLAIATFLRVFGLDQFPPGVQHDEVFVANFAQTILRGQYPIFFELNRGNEPLFMYLTAGLMKIFGENVWALRGAAALCGIGALVLTYLLALRLFQKQYTERGDDLSAGFIGLVAVAGITFSFWHLYESRIGLHTISTYLLAAASFYVFWEGWTHNNRWFLVLSGVLAGLAAYTYRSGIFVPVALLVFVVYSLIFHQKMWGKNLWLIPVIILLTALVYFPLYNFVTTHPESGLARLGDLSGDIDAFFAGNPIPMLNNFIRVLGMFGVSGDPEWRYNVALRPIFDPAWALLFYAGIILCVLRFRRAPYAFVLIWLFVMLLPSILSGSDLSQHRAVGAIGAAFILPALVLDDIRVWMLIRWGRTGGIAFGVVVAALMILAAVGGLNAYFNIWSNNPEVRMIQRADLATAARWLDENQTTQRALVSAEFANDLDRGSFTLVSKYPNRAQFFQGADTFVLPARTDAFVVNPRSGPVNPLLKQQFLTDSPIFESTLADGTTEVEIYELSEQELQILRTTRGLESVARTQDEQLLVRDLRLYPGTQSGGVQNAELWWQIVAPAVTDADGLSWIGLLRDALNYTWSEMGTMGYTPSLWQRDDMVVSLFQMPVPVDAPPQEYNLSLALGSLNGTVPLLKANAPPASPIDLAATDISRGPVPTTQPDLEVRYPNRQAFGEIELFGSDATEEAPAGGTWRVILFWRANEAPSVDYTLRLMALGVDEQVIAQQDQIMLDGIYPTSDWQPGEYLRTVHDFAIPEDAPRDKAEIRIAILDGNGNFVGRTEGVPIAGIEIVGRARNFEALTPAVPLTSRFGETIQLVGYDLPKSNFRAGEEFNVNLAWKALGATDLPYTVFVHLLDANGLVIGQQDSQPLRGEAPTNTWLANEFISDPYEFSIAENAPPGPIVLEIGFYDPASGQRLPVTDADGNSLGDHLLLKGMQLE